MAKKVKKEEEKVESVPVDGKSKKEKSTKKTTSEKKDNEVMVGNHKVVKSPVDGKVKKKNKKEKSVPDDTPSIIERVVKVVDKVIASDKLIPYQPKNTISTNCELPLCMLKEWNTTLNDMDFVLYHLFLHHKDTYGKYFLAERKRELKMRENKANFGRADGRYRIMILDNSAYEFYVKGEQIDFDAYMKCVQELKPDYFILPDTLMNKIKTIEDTKTFLTIDYATEIKELREKYNVQPMGVLQGNSVQEMLDCIQEYADLGIQAIAIPFHNSFFADELGQTKHIDWPDFEKNNLGLPKINQKVELINDGENGEPTEHLVERLDNNYARGRIHFIHKYRHLLNRVFKYVHLLGSHNPLEIRYYRDLKLINSFDTGYPVKLAIEKPKTVLGTEKCKPDIIIDEFFDKKLKEDQIKSIIKNIEVFKKI